MKDSTAGIRLQSTNSEYRDHSSPIYLTSSFQYSSAEEAEAYFSGEKVGDIYSRFSNPNSNELIQKMAFLERVDAGVATASGMAAIFSTLATYLDSGDKVVASEALFGNTLYILKNILPKWGIEPIFVQNSDQKGWKKAIAQRPKMVIVETPTNPGLEVLDLEWLSHLCRSSGALLCVDNCFATPVIQKPATFGADIILHSATKFIDGQGRVLGGLVLGRNDLINPVFDFLRRTGACLSPFNAWILSKSLETLEIRMEKHSQNALYLANQLLGHDKIKDINYPFLDSNPQLELCKKQMKWGGGIICLELKGGKKECFEFINKLKLLTITANLGDTRTIVTHPATTTHSKLSDAERLRIGITHSTIRLSVGLENKFDLLNDLTQALE